MWWGKVVLAGSMVVAVSGSSCDPAPGPGGELTSGSYATQETAITFHFLDHRLEAGCKAQQADAGLKDLARAHGQDLAGNHAALIDAFADDDERKGHIGSDGRLAWGENGRIKAALGYGTQAENVYWHPGKPVDAVEPAWRFWTTSPPHRRTLDNCALTNHGIGVYYDAGTGRTYLVHDFGG
ncbi:hypothetical protein GCM10027589_16500 [Actinocorallia lasiicapitis]